MKRAATLDIIRFKWNGDRAHFLARERGPFFRLCEPSFAPGRVAIGFRAARIGDS